MMNRRPAQSEAVAEHDAARIAHSLKEDFVALIAILDGHRRNGSAYLDGAQPDIADAVAAAERGLRLSEQLVELLRAPS